MPVEERELVEQRFLDARAEPMPERTRAAHYARVYRGKLRFVGLAVAQAMDFGVTTTGWKMAEVA
jgi:hypothetical protein